MSNLRSRLIETAVRPFGDNAEMKHAAAEMLGVLVEPEARGAEAAIARWEAVDGKIRRPVWRVILWILLGVVSVGMSVGDYREVLRYVAWREWWGGTMGTSMPEPDAGFAQGLTDEQKLLLLGSDVEENRTKRTEALWRGQPENAGYFSEHALASIQDSNQLPLDFIGTARAIDPENAWFTYLAAAVEAKGTVREKPAVAGKTEWEVRDQQRWDRALELLRQARTQPEFRNYSAEMMSTRLAMLPTHNLIGRMDGISVLARQVSSPMLRIHEMIRVINAKASMTAETGDVAAFQEISLDAGHFLKGVISNNTGTMLEGVVTTGIVQVMANQFAASADKLGLQEDAARWKRITERIAATRKAGRSRVFTVGGRDPKMISGSLFGNWLEVGMKALEHPPQLTDEDLKPGRLLDHEILSRFCSYVSWIVMGLCLAAVAAYRFRVSRLVSRLAGRMEELLDGRDWGWIVGAGVLLPLAFVFSVNRLTPLGGREFGMLGNALLLPAGHFVGLILLWLTVPPLVTRWRLAKRAGGLGFTKAPWPGWIAAAGAATFAPLIGWAAVSQSRAAFWESWIEHLGMELPNSPGTPERFWIAIGVLGIPLLWVMFCSFRALLSRTRRFIHHATLAKVLIPVYAMAMLLLATMTLGFKAAENHWFQRETFGRIDPAKPGWSVFEYEVAAQMRAELAQILGDKP